MNRSERKYCFIDFAVRDEPALERLSKVSAELQQQKEAEARADDAHWLAYFDGLLRWKRSAGTTFGFPRPCLNATAPRCPLRHGTLAQ